MERCLGTLLGEVNVNAFLYCWPMTVEFTGFLFFISLFWACLRNSDRVDGNLVEWLILLSVFSLINALLLIWGYQWDKCWLCFTQPTQDVAYTPHQFFLCCIGIHFPKVLQFNSSPQSSYWELMAHKAHASMNTFPGRQNFPQQYQAVFLSLRG